MTTHYVDVCIKMQTTFDLNQNQVYFPLYRLIKTIQPLKHFLEKFSLKIMIFIFFRYYKLMCLCIKQCWVRANQCKFYQNKILTTPLVIIIPGL